MEEKPSGYSAGNRLELIASMRRERDKEREREWLRGRGLRTDNSAGPIPCANDLDKIRREKRCLPHVRDFLLGGCCCWLRSGSTIFFCRIGRPIISSSSWETDAVAYKDVKVKDEPCVIWYRTWSLSSFDPPGFFAAHSLLLSSFFSIVWLIPSRRPPIWLKAKTWCGPRWNQPTKKTEKRQYKKEKEKEKMMMTTTTRNSDLLPFKLL